MALRQAQDTAIQRLALVILFLTFCLILLGGVVHSTGSSLACPDWPLCYGEVFPEMKGGVAIEHSHRLLAATVGLLTIGLALLSHRKQNRDRTVARLSLVALFLVIAQGLLGGITVIYRLPTVISTAHLATSMLFVSIILWIVLKSRYSASAADQRTTVPIWITVSLGVVYVQIVLGALVRHTGAAIVCPDLPFCLGNAWPTDLHPTTQLHMVHRYAALLVSGTVLFTGYFLKRTWQKGSRVTWLANAAIALVLIQVILGMISVLTTLAVPAVTAHLGIGAFLLATLVALRYFAGSGIGDTT